MRLVLLALFLASAFLVPGAAAKPGPPPVEALVVKTGQAPCGVAVHGGELWVGVYEAGTVLRLDRAGRVRGRLRVGRWACRIAVDRRAAWITRDNADEIVRVDRRPAKGTSARLRRIEIDSPFDVVLAAGSLWVTSFEAGVLTRLDPASGRTLQSFEIGGYPAGLAFCGGRMWVGHGRDANWLTAIDPATARARRVEVGTRGPGWPRCARGELWVVTRDSVLRVDPRSVEVRTRVRLGGTPAEAAAALDGSVWVTDKERSVVNRIDPAMNRVVDTFPAGPGTYSVARFGGSMWITSFAGSDIRRYDP
jgi:virginiamycin B lyase